MPRPMRSAARTAFAAAQIILLGTALLGFRSALEIFLGVVVLGLLLLNPALYQRPRRRTAPQTAPRPSLPGNVPVAPPGTEGVAAAAGGDLGPEDAGIRTTSSAMVELVPAPVSRS